MRRKYPTVADVGEFGLIERITERLAAAAGERAGAVAGNPDGRSAGCEDRLVVGPGDDAAVLSPAAGSVVSVDLLVEGPDFRRDWSGPYDIGAKAVAVGIADIAAMGAVPTAVVVGLVLPPDTPLDWVEALAEGIADECAVAGACVAGGDVTGAAPISLSVTALGDPAGVEPVRRSGARPGDVVVLCGRTGRSAAGLAALLAGRAEESDLAAVVAAHRRPRVDYAAGRRLAQAGATAMLDVSDGLLADLGHVAAASGVRIDITRDRVPVAGEVALAARTLTADPFTWVLTGGEDHAFAATLPPDRVVPADAVAIGAVADGEGVSVDGRPVDPDQPGGWRHF